MYSSEDLERFYFQYLDDGELPIDNNLPNGPSVC